MDQSEQVVELMEEKEKPRHHITFVNPTTPEKQRVSLVAVETPLTPMDASPFPIAGYSVVETAKLELREQGYPAQEEAREEILKRPQTVSSNLKDFSFSLEASLAEQEAF